MVLGVGKGVLLSVLIEREVPLFEDNIMCCPET